MSFYPLSAIPSFSFALWSLLQLVIMHFLIILFAQYLLPSLNFKEEEGRHCGSGSVLSEPLEYSTVLAHNRISTDTVEYMMKER